MLPSSESQKPATFSEEPSGPSNVPVNSASVNGFLKGGSPSAETFITNSEASKQATTFGCSTSETSILAAANAWHARTAAIVGSNNNFFVIFCTPRNVRAEISHKGRLGWDAEGERREGINPTPPSTAGCPG